MRDYAKTVNRLRNWPRICAEYKNSVDELHDDAADAIEELLAVCRDVAAFVICYADDDEVSAEVLCRKLHKIGVVEKDGAWWTLPAPPKGVE